MNSLKAKHRILYGLMTIVFLSAWYCRDIFTSNLREAVTTKKDFFHPWISEISVKNDTTEFYRFIDKTPIVEEFQKIVLTYIQP